ncbi:MAG: hypothetical protein OEY95_05575 [Candidatus Bathyarchaeota archaeon]|nr:hypothetical protein [Candidatus Bathyarchaeota archaeon]
MIGKGIITKDRIRQLMKESPPLIDEKDKPQREKCLKGASYDLRLGQEYIKEGRFGKLDDEKNPYLEIPEHDVVVVSTFENINMPNRLTGRFGLRLSFAMKGLVLNNEPQIDPGYEGKLFCILYNLSDQPIIIRYLERFATIEFQTTDSAAPPYGRGFEHIFDVVKDRIPKSGLRELRDQFQKLREDVERRLDRFYTLFFTAIAIVIAILGIIVARVLLFPPNS